MRIYFALRLCKLQVLVIQETEMDLFQNVILYSVLIMTRC